MGPYIKIPGSQRPAFSHHINELLGLGPKGKIPNEGMPQREIQGIAVWVEARSPNDPFRIRVMCECPVCGFITAVGRLHQHAKSHK